jgi:hypothetical protein
MSASFLDFHPRHFHLVRRSIRRLRRRRDLRRAPHEHSVHFPLLSDIASHRLRCRMACRMHCHTRVHLFPPFHLAHFRLVEYLCPLRLLLCK